MTTRRNFLKTMAGAAVLLTVSPALAAKKAQKPASGPTLKLRKDDVILYYGDSITDGNRNKENKAFSTPVALGGGYAMSTASTLAWRYPKMNFKFWNRGINGNKTYQMIERLGEDCLGLKYKPTVVSLLTGINDYSLAYSKTGKGDPAKYETDLRELLKQITEGLPGVRLIVLEPYALKGLREKTDKFLPDFYEYQPVARKVSSEFGAVFVPLQERFERTMAGNPKGTYSTDGVHPYCAGIELLSRAWFEAVEVEE